MEDFQGSEYLEELEKNSEDNNKGIKGYKLFLDINGRYLSLVSENPMEFEECKDYYEYGNASIGRNCFCFGTCDDLDILAFAGYNAPIAVGKIKYYPPYFLYDDNQRDCVNLGRSQHIYIEHIMNFDEICKYMSKNAQYAAKLINAHAISKELLLELIDKYAYDYSFVHDVKYSPPIYKDPEMKEYLSKKAAEQREARRKK